jgi:mucin-2
MSNSSGSNIGSIFLVSFCCFLSIIFVVIGVVYSNQSTTTGSTTTPAETASLKSCTADSKWSPTTVASGAKTSQACPGGTTVYAECHDGNWKTIGTCPAETASLKSCTADSKWSPTTVASGAKTSQACPGGTTVYAECHDGNWKTIGTCPAETASLKSCTADSKWSPTTVASGAKTSQACPGGTTVYAECHDGSWKTIGTCPVETATATTSPVYNLLKQKGTGLCLDGNASSLTLNNCSSTNDYQTWNNENGLLKQKGTGMCLDGNAAGMRLASCQVGNDYQTWTNENGLLKQKGTGMCLDGNAAGMRLASCQVGNDYQTWAATITTTTPTTTTPTTTTPTTTTPTTTSKVLSCPSGYIEDLNGTCYTCGSGYRRSWDPVTAPTACVTWDILNPQPKPATIVPKV